jgi:hypothetical protein
VRWRTCRSRCYTRNDVPERHLYLAVQLVNVELLFSLLSRHRGQHQSATLLSPAHLDAPKPVQAPSIAFLIDVLSRSPLKYTCNPSIFWDSSLSPNGGEASHRREG